MVHTIYLEVDVPGELGRVHREAAEHAGPVLVVFPEIRTAGPGSVESLAELLRENPRVAALLTHPIPQDIGDALLQSGRPLFVTPRARIGTPGISGTELSATGAAELVQTPTHAAERLAALAQTENVEHG